MKNRYYATLLAALAFQTATAQDTPTIITEMPKGTVVNLCRSTTGFEAFFGNAMMHDSNGDWQRMVFGEDGAVYLEEPINSFYSQSWIKGRMTKNDTIAFELPQAIYKEEFNGNTSYGYLKRLRPTDETKRSYVVDEKSQVLKYVWKDGKLKKVDEDIIGLVTANDGWTGYGEDQCEAFSQDDNKLCPPNVEQMPDGLMLCMDLDGTSKQVPVKFGPDTETVWMGALTTNMPNHWIKGEVKNGTFQFKNTQFLGIDTKTRSYMYVSSVDYRTAENELGVEYDSVYIVNEPIAFTYNSENGTFNSRQRIAVHKSATDLRPTHVLDYYGVPQINPWVYDEAEPMPPIFSAYMPWDSYDGYAGIEFKISFYSVKQEYMDPRRMYYNMYIDGEKQTFSPAEYKYLTEEMTDVPFSYSDQYDFYKLDDNNRRIYFYKEPKQSIGLETVYVGKNNKLYRSGVIEYLVGESSVAGVAEGKQAKTVEYTDLSGKRISRPTNGVYIRTVTFEDGTKESKKFVK